MCPCAQTTEPTERTVTHPRVSVPAMEVLHTGTPENFYQTPYYVPKVTHPQVVDNYRQMDTSTNRNLPVPTTTECPPNYGHDLHPEYAIFVATLALVLRNLLF